MTWKLEKTFHRQAANKKYDMRNENYDKGKAGVEHAGHPPSSESYLLLSSASFFSPLSSIDFNIKKNLKKNTT
jgi:hypothetical protein